MWNIRPGQEYKLKVFGKAQNTSLGHDVRSYREAIKAAKDPNTKKVYLNQGINQITGAKKGDKHYIKPNTRADVAIERLDGKIDLIEVPSKSDKDEILMERMRSTNSKLPQEMQGEIDIRRINDKN